ncbi:MAG TPA: shikimate kinase [Pyrinomonadaceae bacterium]|nr:shikimate kinase [Pyrinomonadaceae bacterium]
MQLVIVGFMGSGKSSVGRELALRLNCGFVDLDTWIKRTHARSPKEIIEQDGEPRFRQLETAALRKILLRNETAILSVGGGAWAEAENRELIQASRAFTIWLDAPFELCWQRIETAPESRPLARTRADAEQLFRARLPTYQLTEARIPVSQQTPQAIAESIASLFLSRASSPQSET